jgi:hypothetical protein
MRSGYLHTPHARARLRVRRTCRARAHAHTLACTLALCSRPTPRNCHRAEHDAAMTDPRNAVSRAIAAPPSPTRDPIVRPHRLHTDCATGRARARDGRRQQCSHTSTATGSSSAIDGGRRATGAAESHGKVSPPRPRPSLPLSLLVPAPPPLPHRPLSHHGRNSGEQQEKPKKGTRAQAAQATHAPARSRSIAAY